MKWLLPCVFLLACDGVQDVAYRGERELSFSVHLVLDPTGSQSTLTLALVWGSADNASIARVDPVDFACNIGAECVVDVYSRPPRAALRSSRRGQWALGEIVAFTDQDRDGRWDPNESDGSGEPLLGRIALVVSSPDGASDERFEATIPEGMSIVDAMAPCASAEADDQQRFIIAPPGLRAARLIGTRPASYVGGMPHHFDPLCAERLLALPADPCPAFDVIRWLCRNEAPDAELCERCEYQVFPPTASQQECAEWRSRWDAHAKDPTLARDYAEVDAETRLCVAGEPPPRSTCDHVCACDKRHAYCREVEERPLLDCADEHDACLEF